MKTVLITGCSSGYGLATARHFNAQGWNVIATMRNPREDVLPRSERLRVVALDVTKPQVRAVPWTGRVAIAIDEDQRHLTAVLVTERGRVEREQCPERARTQTFEGRRCPWHRSRPARQQGRRPSITQQTFQTAGFRFRDIAPEGSRAARGSPRDDNVTTRVYHKRL
jgi:short chain dehydrogenase